MGKSIFRDATSKECYRCGAVKLHSEFYKSSAAKDGLQTRCKSCSAEVSRSRRTEQREYSKAYRQRHPERHKAFVQRWRSEHAEQYKASKDAWRTRNRDKHNEHSRRWRAENPEESRATDLRSKSKRRMAIASGPVERFTSEEIFERDNWICHLCQSPVDPGLSWPDIMSATIDHVVPLSRGGTHERQNVALAHLGCNSRKGNRV